METFIASQEKLAHKIKNTYSNLKKQGKPKISIGIIDSNLENIKESWTKFQNNDLEIQKIKTDDDKDLPYFVDEFFDATEDSYVEVRGLLQEHKNSLLYLRPAVSASTNASDGNISTNQPVAHRKMPTIAIPKFDGKHSDWINYRDLFKSLVVDQPINNIEKFSYLRESLLNDPLILIKNIPVSENNFLVAWGRLVEYYNNNKTIIYHHVQDLLAIKPMSSECQGELRRVLNQTIDSVDSLEALGGPVDQWDWILVPMTANRLDAASRRDWEILTASKSEPVEFNDIKKFMKERLVTLEAIPATKPQFQAGKDHRKDKSQGNKASNSSISSAKVHNVNKPPTLIPNQSNRPAPNNNKPNDERACSYCSKPHFMAYCNNFKGISAKDKLEFVRSSGLCFNCLGKHQVKECRSLKTCMVCSSKHHTLLHDAIQSSNSSSALSAVQQTSNQTTSTEKISTDATVHTVTSLTSSIKLQEAILLGTAVVRVESENGCSTFARALIDPGSEVLIISEALAKRLQLPVEGVPTQVTGIGDSRLTSSGLTKFIIRSRINELASYQVEALIIREITSYKPKCDKTTLDWSHLRGLPLADPNCSSNAPIDLLLGVDVYQLIMQRGFQKK